jgi:hypothetical protein
VELYPRTARPRPAEEVFLWAAVIERRGRHLLERRGPDGPSYLRGLWGFPTIEAGPGDGPRMLAAYLERRLGGEVTAAGKVGAFRHSITYRRIRLTALRFGVDARPGQGRGAPEVGRLAWHRLERLGTDLPASSLALKVKARLEGAAGG